MQGLVKSPSLARRTPLATHEIFMPALSSTMTEGKIVEWLKQPGDRVERGESVLVVESDKADMDVEAFQEGFLAAVLMPAGGTAPVGETIGLIVETEAEIAAAAANAPAAPAAAQPLLQPPLLQPQRLPRPLQRPLLQQPLLRRRPPFQWPQPQWLWPRRPCQWWRPPPAPVAGWWLRPGPRSWPASWGWIWVPCAAAAPMAASRPRTCSLPRASRSPCPGWLRARPRLGLRFRAATAARRRRPPRAPAVRPLAAPAKRWPSTPCRTR
jgi:pyruvate/2-oxoglutarate dehydrogenase complex dihydrolipoamide acyltransferase (E2) component